MVDAKKHSKIKVLKVLLIILTVFIAVQIGVRFLLTTNFIHQLVKEKIESIANGSLNGRLTIGNIDGDLWKEILLTDIHIHQSDQVVFQADSIYGSYEIWSFLKDVYIINRVKASGVWSKLEEQKDSTFNVQSLIKESENVENESKLAFRINDIQLRDLNSEIYAPSYLPDSTLIIKQLKAEASFSLVDTVGFTLSSLTFLVQEGRLPTSIKVKSSGKVQGEEITLNEMVIETGRSLLSANAEVSLKDSTLSASASTHPFSLADIQPYLEVELPVEELDVNLSLFGSLNNLSIQATLNSSTLKNIEFVAGLDLKDQPKVNRFEISGEGLDLAALTKDSINADIGSFKANFSGVLTQELDKSVMDWNFIFNSLRFEEYYFAKVLGKGTLKESNLAGNVEITTNDNQRLTLVPILNNVTAENPLWNLKFNSSNIDMSYWLKNPELASSIHLRGSISGSGFQLSSNNWKYTLKSSESNKMSSFMEQEFTSVEVGGTIAKDQLTSKGNIQLNESSLSFEVAAKDIFEGTAIYTYFLETEEFDISEINQLSDFPTSINARLYGEGRGFDLEDCLIFAVMRVDSSYINGSEFEQLSASLTFTKGVLNISDGILKSEIVEGEFSGRKNVTDETDPENWLTVDMRVKNLQPLAPLANAEIMNANGLIKGRVTQDTSGVLRGDMDIDFQDIIFDTVFAASKIKGAFEIEMKELRKFDLNLGIENPVISKITFQDIELVSSGIVNKEALEAEFELSIVGSERGELVQDGFLTMNIPAEKIDVVFNSFDFITSDSRLDLQRPFNVHLEGKSISTDTLDLKSTNDAFLKFALPYADSLEQYAWVEGENFDFGLLQEVTFGERYLDGVLSGELIFNQSSEEVTGNGQLSLTGVKYKEVEADSLALVFDIINERLSANGSMSWENEKKVIGELDVPFVLKEREELNEEFYSRPVEGSLTINPSQLKRFKPLLDEFGITETEGVLSFKGKISGSAGEPNFSGEFVLNDPVLSGIDLDTVTASFNYDNVKGGLQVESEIRAVGQRAASIQVEYPMAYDFRLFKLILPEEEEIIKVLAKTENFNVAVLNDFLDEEYLKGFKGMLNADLKLEGTTSKMVPFGYLKLSEAKVSVPIAGITLDALKTDIEFTSEGLKVKEISAKSGRGNFNANGLITLEGIIPKTVNLNARANQFRLANTDDYNIVIDLNSKLTGNARTPKATGKLTVRNGFVFLQDFGENTIEEVQLEGEELSSFSPYDSLAIEMEFEIQRDFYVRNRTYLDMEIELVGNLDAQKQTNEELSLFGTLNGVRGYVRPLGKLFKMEEASFTFSGPIDNPDLNIKSKYTPPTRQKGESVVLYYIIEGTAQDPEFSFDSNPQMDQSDIVCYTLFTKPCYSLESWQNIFSSGETTSATDVLTDVLLDEVEAIATRQLGVDVVQIDNSGSSGGTSIKTGWYLNERTFFAIINEISGSTPKTLFVLEYILSEKLDLIITQGDDTRRGIDIRFQHDY